MSWEDLTGRTWESDDELRARVIYVGGDGPVEVRRIQLAEGLALDAQADRFGLRRRPR